MQMSLLARTTSKQPGTMVDNQYPKRSTRARETDAEQIINISRAMRTCIREQETIGMLVYRRTSVVRG